MSKDHVYCADVIDKTLIGAVVVASCIDIDNEYFGIVFRKPNGKECKLWIDSDAEANSCGWITIENFDD